ncbi:Heart- and neural crest derivatives-expressed protein 2 [Armadillidium vulgare]|nr:Heart- and neural crest derivatives-expressed protein 2 [Armadillidium vulgare]
MVLNNLHYIAYNDTNGYVGNVFQSCPPHYWNGDDLVDAYGRVIKRRTSANKKERRRTQSINNAFAELRECIPNVPADTKLSKIKTLRLATSYIAYLMGVLRTDVKDSPTEAFKAELPPKNKSNNTEHEKEETDLDSDSAVTTSPSMRLQFDTICLDSTPSSFSYTPTFRDSPVTYTPSSCLAPLPDSDYNNKSNNVDNDETSTKKMSHNCNNNVKNSNSDTNFVINSK